MQCVIFIKDIKIKMKAIRMLDTTAGLRSSPTPIGQLAETVKRDDDMTVIIVMMAMVMEMMMMVLMMTMMMVMVMLMLMLMNKIMTMFSTWHSLRQRREGTSGPTDRTHSRTGP